MVQFNVPDMTCGACASRINRALAQADLPADLQIEIDVGARQVRLPENVSVEVALAVQQAITRAGYSAEQVHAATATSNAPRVAGCCCAARKTNAVDVNQGAPARAAGCCG